MAGQAHHVLTHAPSMDPAQVLPHAQDRYRREVERLCGVLDRRLAGRAFVAGDFLSIADIAIRPWAQGRERRQQTLDDRPNLARRLADLAARPAFRRGRAVGADRRGDLTQDRAARKVPFGQS